MPGQERAFGQLPEKRRQPEPPHSNGMIPNPASAHAERPGKKAGITSQ